MGVRCLGQSRWSCWNPGSQASRAIRFWNCYSACELGYWWIDCEEHHDDCRTNSGLYFPIGHGKKQLDTFCGWVKCVLQHGNKDDAKQISGEDPLLLYTIPNRATGKLHNTLHVSVERLDHTEELGRAPNLRWDPETNMSLRITSCMRSVRWVNEARHFAAVFSAYPVAGAERIPCMLSSALRWNHTETSLRVDSVGHYCGLFRTTRAHTLPTMLSLYLLQYLRTHLFLYRVTMLEVIMHWGTCLSVQHRQNRQYYVMPSTTGTSHWAVCIYILLCSATPQQATPTCDTGVPWPHWQCQIWCFLDYNSE